MLSLQGFGDAYTDAGCAEGDDTCLENVQVAAQQSANAQTQAFLNANLPGTTFTPEQLQQTNFSSWPCSSCTAVQIPANPAALAQCQAQCGNQAAMTSVSPIVTAQATSGLPAGASASGVPGLPGMPTPGSLPQPINWWIVGPAAILGLVVGAWVASSLARSA